MHAAPSQRVVCPSCRLENSPAARTCARCEAPLDAVSGEASRPSFAVGSDRPPRPSDVGDGFAPPGPDPLIGIVVADRYRLVEPIGRGGMGVVYRAEHVRIGKLMAMKLLTGELSRDRDVVGRFKREALMASKLSHPNTVQVFDFGSSDGLTYLVMELLIGSDLGRALRIEGPMPFDRIGKIVVQVCSSLAEAHAAGIVHRDLKPENIFLLKGREGQEIVKVLDFGLAKLRESSELNEVTSQGAIVGTPFYMAPEQIRGEPVDGRADVYALGALIYRGLTGTPPFTGNSPMAVFTKHLTEDAVPPCDKVPQLAIPRAVSDIVMQALAKEPDKRFQSVDELQAAVVSELRKTGQSSVERLLNSGEMRKLAKLAGRVGDKTIPQGLVSAAEPATKDEVAAYEQKLRRQRTATRVGILLTLAAAGAAGWRGFTRATAVPVYDGTEREPNDQASDANPLPFGKSMKGQIGKRIDPQRSDRDFFSIDVPAGAGKAGTAIRITTTALPNMATCTNLYRLGLEQPLGVYCAGRPGRDLLVDALRVEPGRYLLAVMQDRDAYGRTAPPVYENVSDQYVIEAAAAEERPAWELEPNDSADAATRIAASSEVHGALAWMRDEDFVCADAGVTGKVRFVVRDAEKRPRDAGAVLEVTPRGGPRDGVPVHVHRAQPGAKIGATEVTSPWTSEPFSAAAGVCLKLKLAPDPWSDSPAPIPPAGPDEWVVRVEPAP